MPLGTTAVLTRSLSSTTEICPPTRLIANRAYRVTTPGLPGKSLTLFPLLFV